MKKLYIVHFATEDSDKEIEWFWCNSEEEATEQYENYLEEIGWKGEADIIDIYEVIIPEDVKEEIRKEIK